MKFTQDLALTPRGMHNFFLFYSMILVMSLCGLWASPTRASQPDAAGSFPQVNALDATTLPILLLHKLRQAAPRANPLALRLALSALSCAATRGMPASQHLAVIDYSRPSTEPRLWVFDLHQGTLLFEEWVAHGRNSGDNIPRSFSNTLGSLQTSLGLFRTKDTYMGNNGYSLRMEGLEADINNNAMSRALVIHGASYVNPTLASHLGRLGRSWGCPAVASGIARPLIDTLKGEQFIFSYYPDNQWLATSQYLNCPAAKLLSQLD